MDRTSRIGVFICALLLFFLYVYTAPPPKPQTAVAASAANPAAAPAPNPTQVPIPPAPVVPEVTTVLENPAIKVTLTSKGAAIKEVELKQHLQDDGHVVLNQKSHSNVLELSGWPGADTAVFQVKESSPEQVVYAAELPGGVTWTRSYIFGPDQETESGLSGYIRIFFRELTHWLGRPETAPLIYTLDVKDTLTNTSSADAVLPAFSLSVGRAEPLLIAGHYQPISNMYLGSGWFTQKFHLTTVNDFNPGFIPVVGIPTRDKKDLFSSTSVDDAPLQWLGVENQFFTVLLTPGADHPIQHGLFQCFNPRDASGMVPPTEAPDIEASALFPEIKIPAGKTVALDYSLYAGPKEYDRLDALGDQQGELMNYDGVIPFSLLIVPMLAVLHFWYLILGNYGVAIILLTLMIKAITWPLQSIANHSGKRMQALAPLLKEIQAKYKEQPEKLQTETFALYREYGVNPFGGCLPALIQMPVFFSLYFMLQNAVELRGQSFLWVHDLTQPDSLFAFTLPFPFLFFGNHIALHLLPVMVTGLTMVMMRMTPQIGDPTQAKIAQWMPLIFLFIFYNFAAALSLYYVINNCVSIIQIYRNLKKPLPALKRKPRK